ncbi:MAG: glycosyltransferase family 2 protein [Polyangiaceae bacterium]
MSARGVVVIPAYNEEQGLPTFIPRLAEFLSGQRASTGVDFSILLVDDGSVDRTTVAMAQLAADHAAHPVTVDWISLSRNFGHQAAIMAGMTKAAPSADFVITMDADGEHPFTLVPELVARWREGAPIVHTARRPDRRLAWTKRVASSSFYWLLSRLSGLAVASGMADYKLWDGDLLRQVAASLPNCGSTRAFASWLVPLAPVVAYDQNVVEGRMSRFTSRKMWSMAASAIVRYSDLPLRFSMMVGVAALLAAAALTVFVVWAALTGRTVAGWASTLLVIAIFGALQSLAIGILSEYILRNLFRHTLPKFVVRRRLDAPGAPGAHSSRGSSAEESGESADSGGSKESGAAAGPPTDALGL